MTDRIFDPFFKDVDRSGNGSVPFFAKLAQSRNQGGFKTFWIAKIDEKCYNKVWIDGAKVKCKQIFRLPCDYSADMNFKTFPFDILSLRQFLAIEIQTIAIRTIQIRKKLRF